jgi:hypothetical protein
MMERYLMLERTFRNTIKKYADAEELDDNKDQWSLEIVSV